jgi:hypothetical protein
MGQPRTGQRDQDNQFRHMLHDLAGEFGRHRVEERQSKGGQARAETHIDQGEVQHAKPAEIGLQRQPQQRQSEQQIQRRARGQGKASDQILHRA